MRTRHSMSCRGDGEQWGWAPDVALTSSLSGAAAHQVPSPWRNPMKPRLILLFTPDRTLDQLVRRAFLLVAKQVERNVGAGELYLTGEEIGEIEGRNTYQPELVTAV